MDENLGGLEVRVLSLYARQADVEMHVAERIGGFVDIPIAIPELRVSIQEHQLLLLRRRWVDNNTPTPITLANVP